MHQPRDQKGDEGRRDLPGRQLGTHAGDGEAEVHSGARVGQEEVPGHVQTGGDGQAEGKDGGLEEDGAEDGLINLRKNLDGTDLAAEPCVPALLLERKPFRDKRTPGGRPYSTSSTRTRKSSKRLFEIINKVFIGIEFRFKLHEPRKAKLARTAQFHYGLERRVAQTALRPWLEKPKEFGENLLRRYPPRLPSDEFLFQQP